MALTESRRQAGVGRPGINLAFQTVELVAEKVGIDGNTVVRFGRIEDGYGIPFVAFRWSMDGDWRPVAADCPAVSVDFRAVNFN